MDDRWRDVVLMERTQPDFRMAAHSESALCYHLAVIVGFPALAPNG